MRWDTPPLGKPCGGVEHAVLSAPQVLDIVDPPVPDPGEGQALSEVSDAA